MSGNPYSSPSENLGPPPAAPPPGSEHALAKAGQVGTALMVVGIICCLLATWGVVNSALVAFGIGPGAAAAAQQQGQVDQLEDVEVLGVQVAPMLKRWIQFQGPIGIISGLLQFAAGAFVVFGGLRAQQLRSYPVVLAASVVTMLPVLSACCCIGIPVGIWSLVVLLDPQVRPYFH